jgi:LuxR family maltose regulon positive regulatory protein
MTLAFGVFALALIRLAQAQVDAATELIDSLAEYLKRIQHNLADALVDTFRTELALRHGNRVAVLRPMAHGLAAKLPRWYFYAPLLTEIKLLLDDGSAEKVVEAQRQIAELEDEVRRYGVTHTHIDALALQALAFRLQGDEPAALDRLAEALQLAEAGGFIRSFVDHGAPMAGLLDRLQRRNSGASTTSAHLARVLAAFDMARPPASPAPAIPAAALIEPLTAREAQLFHLVATDLSPAEMARRLSLSETTVRTHIRNIYAKLDVHSRFEAIQRGRELGLLQDASSFYSI